MVVCEEGGGDGGLVEDVGLGELYYEEDAERRVVGGFRGSIGFVRGGEAVGYRGDAGV